MKTNKIVYHKSGRGKQRMEFKVLAKMYVQRSIHKEPHKG